MKPLPPEGGSHRPQNAVLTGKGRALRPIQIEIRKISTRLYKLAEKGDLSPQDISDVTNVTRLELSRLYIKRGQLSKFPRNKKSPRRRR